MTATDPARPHLLDAGDHLVVVNRNPGRRNALTPALYEVTARALALAGDSARIGAVVITGADGYFCSGGDLTQLVERRALSEPERRARIEALHDMIRAIPACPRPVIAAVEGGAAGAGLSLVLACDLVVASRDATFSAAYVKAGLVPDGGLSHALGQALPPAAAARLLLMGDTVPAGELARFGLVSDLCAAGEALTTAQALARRLAAGPADAQAAIKALVRAARGATLAEQLDRERDAMARALAGAEAGEGILAFLDKRPADFRRLRHDADGGDEK